MNEWEKWISLFYYAENVKKEKKRKETVLLIGIDDVVVVIWKSVFIWIVTHFQVTFNIR